MSTTNPLQQIFLAGVGALAYGAEKSQEVVDQLVQKGQITVEEGKSIAKDVASQAEDNFETVRDDIIKAHMQGMTKDQRDEFAARVAEMAANMDEDAELEVEEEVEIEAAEK